MIKEDKDIKKAHEEYIKFTRDDELREIYEARMKWQLDQNTLIYSAEQKGIEQGIEQGKLENARIMLNEGFEISIISRITGLPENEIEDLQ